MRYAYHDGRASVHVPGDLGEKENLPVVVWIHGYLLAPLLTDLQSYFFFLSFSIRKGWLCFWQRVLV